MFMSVSESFEGVLATYGARPLKLRTHEAWICPKSGILGKQPDLRPNAVPKFDVMVRLWTLVLIFLSCSFYLAERFAEPLSVQAFAICSPTLLDSLIEWEVFKKLWDALKTVRQFRML